MERTKSLNFLDVLRVIFSFNIAGEACSIVLRGASSHLLDEAERSLHDALCVIVETVKVVVKLISRVIMSYMEEAIVK